MRVRQTERRSMPCECADVICALLVPRPEVGARTLRARKRGGIARTSRRATLSADAPHRALGTVADVLSLLEEAANEVRTGGLEPKLANCVGYLCSVALNGLAQVPSRTSSVVQFLVVPPSGTCGLPILPEWKECRRK